MLLLLLLLLLLLSLINSGADASWVAQAQKDFADLSVDEATLIGGQGEDIHGLVTGQDIFRHNDPWLTLNIPTQLPPNVETACTAAIALYTKDFSVR